MRVTETCKSNMSNEYIKTITVLLNPYDNGGEGVTLSVDIYDNGDGIPKGMYTNTHIESFCYGVHSSKLTLWGVGFQDLSNAAGLIQAEIDKFTAPNEDKLHE